MSLSASAASSDEFPVGLRVLVVDDDPTCLKILERMLRACRYQVTKCSRVQYALNELRNNKKGFDVVISDVHMPKMDGFKLLEYVGLEMDLPVIMMSADDSKNVVMKGVEHGACDYLTKPVRMDALKNIWQHVVRKKKNERQELEAWERGYKHDANEDDEWKSSKRKGDDDEDYASFKKARVVWTVELHQQFVAAVNHIGIDKAVPKKILDVMNVPGLTRENVASHLQKYRLCLSKITEEPRYLGGLNNSFVGGPSNPGFGTMTSLAGIDLHPYTGYQPFTGLSMPVYQANAFGLEKSNLRVPDAQQLQLLSNVTNQSCLLQGIPRVREPELFAVPESTGVAQLDNYDLFNELSSYAVLEHTPTIENNSVSSSALPLNQSRGVMGNSTSNVVLQQEANIQGIQTVEEQSSASNHLPFQFDQDDLFSVMLKQQAEDSGGVEAEFNFDLYGLDDIL